MNLQLDKDLLAVALKQVILSENVSREDVRVMAEDPIFHVYIMRTVTRLTEANSGEQLFAMIATVFHLGLETGVAYTEVCRGH